MQIENLKELQKLMAICRKHGISTITVDGITMTFDKQAPSKQVWGAPNLGSFSTPSPEEDIKVPQYNGPITPPDAVPMEGLTEEQLLNWSSQGHEPVEA